MRTGRPKKPLHLTPEENQRLQSLAHRARSQPMLARRARVILGSAEGLSNQDVARKLRVSPGMVVKWRSRFLKAHLEGLYDEPRPGAPRSVSDVQVEQVIIQTLETTPRGETHWSTRGLAEVTGVSPSTVGRIWRAHGLKPHRVKSFKLSNDPRFAEKLEDVVTLYLDPPKDSIVLSLDEKCQIQALDRSQPGLPWKKGRCGTMTRDYKRHGTTTLFAAMNPQDGTVIDVCMPRHTHKEWIRFLRLIDRRTPRDKQLHLILDNYSAHKTPEVKLWLARHPRSHLHFVPTSSSWLNVVERFFRDLTVKRIRRGIFANVGELVNTIRDYIDHHNQKPKPYLWTAKATDILEKVKRAWAALKARGYTPKNKKFAALQSIERRLSAATT